MSVSAPIPQEKKPDLSIRAMPQSEEAEIALLGSILLNPRDVIDLCSTKLTVDHFYRRNHQVIFSTILHMQSKGEPIDLVSVTTRLKDLNRLDEAGGDFYLGKLAVSYPTAVNAEFYIEVLLEKYRLRRIIEVSSEAIRCAYEEQDDPEKVLEKFEADSLKIRDSSDHKDLKPIKNITDDMVDKVREILENRGKLPGLSWGFVDIDKLTFGLRAGEMVVIAARPGIGKTSLALNVAERLILEKKVPVGIFSLEMTSDQLALRMACSKAKVDMWQLYKGGLPERDLQEFVRAAGMIGNSPFYVMDSSQLSIGQIRAASRRIKQQYGVQLIIIDYLQLVAASGVGRNDNREREVAMISGGIKALAKELDVPVIVLCQLNRSSEKDSRAPRLSDLRESGAIEQDADIVCLLSRVGAYDQDTGSPQDAVEANMIIAKNRNGPVGEIKLTFLAKYTRFEDYAGIDHS